MRENREEISGDSENIIGALTNALQRVGPMARAGRSVGAPQFSQAQLQNQVGGSGRDNKLRAPLGMGVFVFSAATGTTHKFIVEPQEAFRGERLVVEVGADAAAAGVLAAVEQITVGSLPQTPSTEFGIPAAMFRPDATDANMNWQICPAGTKIIIEVSISAQLADADTATVQLGVYGEWIRG